MIQEIEVEKITFSSPTIIHHNVDLEIPIEAVQFPDKIVVFNGNKRLYKAIKENKRTIKAIVLNHDLKYLQNSRYFAWIDKGLYILECLPKTIEILLQFKHSDNKNSIPLKFLLKDWKYVKVSKINKSSFKNASKIYMSPCIDTPFYELCDNSFLSEKNFQMFSLRYCKNYSCYKMNGNEAFIEHEHESILRDLEIIESNIWKHLSLNL